MKKRIVWILFLLSVAICFAGCDRKKQPRIESDKDALYLYYLNTDGNTFYPVEYESEERESLKLAKAMLHKMSDSTNTSTDSYKRAIPESITINTVLLDDKIVTVDFVANYNQLSVEQEILCRSAIVKTLVQIEGVDGVQFTVEGTPISDDTIAVGVMNEESFMVSDEDVYSVDAQVSLYYANKTGDKLVEVVQDVKAKNNMSLEQAALEQLKRASREKDVLSPLPEGLEIQKVQIYDNICYVSLSKNIVDDISGVNDEVMVYAMVNTIVGMGNVNSVQFTVNGEKVKTVHEFDKFDQVMTFNYNVCEYTN